MLPADDFNRWRSGYSGVWVCGLQQLALDALWYIDPDAGVDGVWDNALAAEPPIYNDDFTQMTVKLREGIYWSDGVEFTADDLYYTVDLLKKTPGMANQGLFDGNIDHMEQPDRNTVVFYLKAPNSRFHAAFTVRWGALYIMPKHIFEQVDGPGRIHIQSSGQPGCLHAQRFRSERHNGTCGNAVKTGSGPRSPALARCLLSTPCTLIRAPATSALSPKWHTNWM